MKKILVLLLAFLPVALMASTLNGKIEGTSIISNVSLLKLNNTGSLDFITMSVISSSGEFTLSDDIETAEIYTLQFSTSKGQKLQQLLVLKPNENVNIVYQMKNQELRMKSVSGSENMQFMLSYHNEAYKMVDKALTIQEKARGISNQADLVPLQLELNSVLSAYNSSVKKLIATRPELLGAALMAYTEASNGTNTDSYKDVLKLVYSKQHNKENFIVKQIKNLVENPIEVGKMALEIDLPGIDGKNIKLSSLKGKVVLIDFWASWCRPCRMENPNVVKAYNMFKDKGFTVFSVSLDSNASAWQSAIKADGLSWPYHVSSLKQWNCPVAKDYRVRGIPYSILIDKDGKIIAISLRGEELIKKLSEVLK